jgi:hypothetical protein
MNIIKMYQNFYVIVGYPQIFYGFIILSVLSFIKNIYYPDLSIISTIVYILTITVIFLLGYFTAKIEIKEELE